ncbi:MAG: T9SS type A sorting domain-containing protein [Bacteroidetes bacterium]|nr:T9SS type A sorting domain-containing protein [Bacteroidota bacterium]
MKKNLLISFALLSCICFANAQGLKHSTKFYKPAGFTWKWDTIFTYDTTAMKELMVQTFNTNGTVANKTTQVVAGSAWENISQSIFAYDTINEITTEIRQGWKSGAWGNSARNTLTLTISGLTATLTKVHESWLGGIWVNAMRYTHTMDVSSDSVLSDLTEQWDGTAWVNNARILYSFDGTTWVQTNEVWQYNTWLNSFRDSYVLDIGGDIQYMLHEIWNGTSWVSNTKYLYTNNPDGYPLSITRQEWVSPSWNDSTTITYTYDANDNAINGKFELFKSSVWIPWMGTMKVFYSGGSLDLFQRDYVNNEYRFEAKYARQWNGIGDLRAGDSRLSVTPNPAHENIRIEFPAYRGSTVSVYDIQGRIVMQQPLLQEKTEINISSLPKGIYFVKAGNASGTAKAKFIKD